jgi:predicted dehydrogenase
LKNNQIGIVGLGYWGTNIINTLEKMGYKNILCYDLNEKNAQILKKRFRNIKICENLDELIREELLGIIIVTNTKNHFSIAKKCIAKNHNIFIEKPATDSYPKLKQLVELAKKNNKIMMCGYIYGYNVYIEYIKKILKKKILGNINYISFERSNLGPIRNDISCVFDLASHDLSTCTDIFGKNLRVINAFGFDLLKKKIHDMSTIVLSHKKIKIEIKSSWLNPEKIRKLIIIGSKKMLLFDEMDKGKPIKIYNKYAEYPKLDSFKKDFFTEKANIYYGKTFFPKIKFTSPLTLEMREFIKSIKKHKTPKTDGLYALNVMRLIEKVNKKLF